MAEKKKISPAKQELLRDFEEFTLELLAATPVVRLADLEPQVHDEFAERIAAEGLNSLLRSGRTEWANLVDWVKANMTRRGWIKYFDVGRDAYLAYLRPCGNVNGVSLVTFEDATRVRDALIGLVVQG
jgi:hypothetical protein